jgi:beta-ureidopropionase
MRVVTSSFGTMEYVQPPYNLSSPDAQENMRRAERILEAAGALRPDLAILPETFIMAGFPASAIPGLAEEPGGPVFGMLASMAKKHHMNLVAGYLAREDKRLYNRALVFDREGRLIGQYDKRHPVGGEKDAGVLPGQRAGVFELDVGKIGVAICFDINWPEIWRQFADARIDLACWISAYEGGFPLSAYAWQHQYPIVSSVYPFHSRFYDLTGEVVTLTSQWQRIGLHELNLERQVFHTDNQMQKIIQIQEKYGTRVRITSFTEEHLFVIESRDPVLSMSDIKGEFGLVNFADYIRSCS